VITASLPPVAPDRLFPAGSGSFEGEPDRLCNERCSSETLSPSLVTLKFFAISPPQPRPAAPRRAGVTLITCEAYVGIESAEVFGLDAARRTFGLALIAMTAGLAGGPALIALLAAMGLLGETSDFHSTVGALSDVWLYVTAARVVLALVLVSNFWRLRRFASEGRHEPS
jgi:hypothetical protein